MTLHLRTTTAVDDVAVASQSRRRATTTCGDCRHAQVFAVQPRVTCTHAARPVSASARSVAEPACDAFERRRDGLSLSVWAATGAGRSRAA